MGDDTYQVAEKATLMAHRMFETHQPTIQSTAKIHTHVGYRAISIAAIVLEYDRIIETKGYLGVPYTDDQGNMVRTQSIDEFCRHFLSHNAAWFRQQKALLDTLGETTVEWLTDLGVSGRRLAQLKAAPEDLRRQMAQAVESGDRDSALSLIEAATSGARQDKEQADARLLAQEKIIARKEQRINELDQQLAAREVADDRHQAAMDIQVEVTRAAADAHDAIDMLEACRNTFLGSQMPDTDVSMLAVTTYDLVEQVYAAAQNLMSRCQDELAGYRTVVAPTADGGPDDR